VNAAMAMPCVTAARPRGFQRRASLAEVLDRVLTAGVVVTGEIVISVADIDLVYLGVNVVLCSAATARGATAVAKGPVNAQC
jgi:gas vesicle structural protein